MIEFIKKLNFLGYNKIKVLKFIGDWGLGIGDWGFNIHRFLE